MNVHVPQTNETKVEALEVMMVPKMIVSPQANKPVIGNRPGHPAGVPHRDVKRSFSLLRSPLLQLGWQIRPLEDRG